MSKAFRTSRFEMMLRTRDFCSSSRETLSGRSSESTIPLRKVSQRGSSLSSKESEMKTRLTKSFIGFTFSLNMSCESSHGTADGRKSIARNSTCPSSEKWAYASGVSYALNVVL